jgi:hypothetical protein
MSDLARQNGELQRRSVAPETDAGFDENLHHGSGSRNRGPEGNGGDVRVG